MNIKAAAARAAGETPKPRRGDIWRANLEPTIGSEIQKNNRPVLVLSRPKIGEPSVYLCAPITEFLPERDEVRFWRVPIGDTPENGLDKMSCIDVSQTRALDTQRFQKHCGRAHVAETEGAAEALALCVGITPQTRE